MKMPFQPNQIATFFLDTIISQARDNYSPDPIGLCMISKPGILIIPDF